ncbi:acyl dehydratase [Microbacterium sp. W4I4]|uniref:MaoC family dehydratase n=1 Tax=Microbacterium sp. W4I4 TaxID=3042295 RepID=UPI0027843FA5|nr:MaoC family dehydratase [Microbacterium sp. W4I4]MDQ0615509.1 acyl dehydratase [Microbacterium sp. W4I4]
MPKTLQTSQLAPHVGAELGVSDWLLIDQNCVDVFAAATGDEQWIHTDPTRAAGGVYGTTVAHGLLTLSLLPQLAAQVYRIDGARSRINYGYDRVRFPQPVLVGSRIRDRIVLDAVEPVPTGLRVRMTHTVEIEGTDRPACVASALLQLIMEEGA